MVKACNVCGGHPARCGHPQATLRLGSTRAYREQRAIALAGAISCWICGEGPRAGDPFEADHLTPHSRGGTHNAANLAAAHRSCNRRRGAG